MSETHSGPSGDDVPALLVGQGLLRSLHQSTMFRILTVIVLFLAKMPL